MSSTNVLHDYLQKLANNTSLQNSVSSETLITNKRPQSKFSDSLKFGSHIAFHLYSVMSPNFLRAWVTEPDMNVLLTVVVKWCKWNEEKKNRNTKDTRMKNMVPKRVLTYKTLQSYKYNMITSHQYFRLITATKLKETIQP